MLIILSEIQLKEVDCTSKSTVTCSLMGFTLDTNKIVNFCICSSLYDSWIIFSGVEGGSGR